jgi:hypothetical protein
MQNGTGMGNRSSERLLRSVRSCLAAVLVSLLVVVGCGCTITIGGGFTDVEDDSQAGPAEVPTLPEPTVWHVPPPELTPEQQQRQDEVDQFLAEQYRDYKIIEATQGYSGDIIYWVDSDSIPGADLEPPPPTWTEADLTPPPGVELARSELELYSELRGPDWTTPIHRPDFSAYVMGMTDATSIIDYIENFQVSGMPAGDKRLYAGLASPIPNTGASASINQFEGDVEQGTFSLIEVAVMCRGSNYPATHEQIGAAVSRDRTAGSFNAKARIRVEFLTHGDVKLGNRVGGWDGQVAGFIPRKGRPYGPEATLPASTPGLATQYEHRFDISQDASGNWWIAHNGNTLGHYPANLFTMLNGGACESSWYGEVYDPTPTDWTWTNMGSGEFPPTGYGYASYVRDPSIRDLFGTPVYPGDCPEPFCRPRPFSNKCYQRTQLTISPPPWSRFFYLGGPGGDAPGCD